MDHSVQVSGVSSTLLFIAVIGAYTPTIFYEIYGSEQYTCTSCIPPKEGSTGLNCTGCSTKFISLDQDPIYTKHTRPLTYAMAAILPLAYVVGLIFSFYTHKHIYDEFEQEQEEKGIEGHDAPVWSKKKGFALLITATILFALIAEELIEALQPTLDSIGLEQAFVGLTVFAIVPSAAEYVNAIQFAIHNNVALSLEIGSSVSIQVAMIQMPALVVFSAVLNHLSAENSFVLVFPLMQAFAVIMAVIIINYVTNEGVANYFKGSALVFIFVLLIVSFYFVPENEEFTV